VQPTGRGGSKLHLGGALLGAKQRKRRFVRAGGDDRLQPDRKSLGRRTSREKPVRIQRGSDGTVLNAAVLTADEVAHERVLCPACMLKVFESWPEGWDAHAAHRCEGVNLGTPEERKAEFRRVLGHLFRGGERQGVTPIQLDRLVDFVRTLEGQVLQTLAQNKPFTVKVEEKGFVYTPEATGRARLQRFPRVQLYLDEYAQSGSLEASAYHGGSNQSYILTLLRMFKK